MKKLRWERDRDLGLDYSMDFEIAMRNFFGDNAYHIADSGIRLESNKKWLRKAVKLMKKRTLTLDTTTRHREIISTKLDVLERTIKSLKDHKGIWAIIYGMFSLSASMYGYDYVSGVILHNQFYHQNFQQNHSSRVKGGYELEEVK